MRISDLYEGIITDRVRKQAREHFESHIDWSGGSGEGILMQYAHDNDNDIDELPENLLNTRAFKSWFKSWMDDCIDTAYYTLENHYHGAHELTIYRVIMAPENWKPDAQSLGIFWSWEESAAQAHWGSFSPGMKKYLIVGEVAKDHVDWASTLAANAHPDYEEEQEITLLAGSPVKILKILYGEQLGQLTSEKPNVEGMVVPA